MSDDKTKQDYRDDTRIDAHDQSEVEYLHRKYPCYTHQQIVAAIKKYGPLRQKVEEVLRLRKLN